MAPTLYHMKTGQVIAPEPFIEDINEPEEKVHVHEIIEWVAIGMLFMAFLYLGAIWAAI